MSDMNLVLPILVPAAAGLLALLMPGDPSAVSRAKGRILRERARWLPSMIAVLATAAVLVIAILLFSQDRSLTLPWLGTSFGLGIDISLRLTRMSAFILLSLAGFSFLVSLYASASMVAAPSVRPFFSWLLFTTAMASGAVLADNLVLFIVFWEGLLLTLFGMISTGARRPYGTAIKAFVIVGVTDLCMMLGVMLTARLAGTFTMSAIRLPVDGLGGAAFILLMIGAMGKSGAMPFHSWIPDAALDAPLPFMAMLPGSMEKLLGIYFLARISIDLFALTPHSWVSTVLMIVGAITILLAVLMALVQHNYKRLLSYHAISQVGYMILGIGTAVPAGIIGGLFHMVNNAIYKSALFLTGGAVEKQAGTTDLEKLGGLARSMPVTAICFIIAAVSISGVPPFNGFFSKELVYDAALERGWIYYAAALAGSFFTAASFLKLGHAAFFGKRAEGSAPVKEAPLPMLIPMIVLAAVCVLFGVVNSIPLVGLIQPAVGEAILEGHSFAGFPPNTVLVGLTVAVLLAAVLNHWYGVRRTGRGLGAVDHIHHAPGAAQVYAVAEAGKIDPYRIGRWIVKGFGYALWGIDRAVDWVTETATVAVAGGASLLARRAHNGNLNRYVLWSLAGAGAVTAIAILVFGGAR